jgi:MFS family permease
MLPIRFFRSRAFSAGNTAIFLTFASLFAAVFFYAQLLQFGLGHGPLDTGLRLVPWTATFLTVAPVAGALADKIGERPLMVTGLLLQAVGQGWLALIAEPGLGYTEMLAPFIVSGVGVSMAIPAAQNSVLGSVGMDAVGKAAGANSMMRELGGVFGIAIAVAVFAAVGSYASPATFTDGFGPAMGVGALLALAGAVAGLALPGRRPGRRGPRPPDHQLGDTTMRQVMVRYKVKPDRVAENEELVRAVYQELARTQPEGLKYATYRLDDNVTFVHIASSDTVDRRSPLTNVEAFKRFQKDIEDRVEEGPVVTEVSQVGSYRS